MNLKKLLLAGTAAGALLAGPVLADDSLAEWAGEKKLANKMVVLGQAPVKKMKEAGIAKPKRVGLVSFYLYDNGSFEFNAMANAYGGTYERTHSLTPKGANHFATKLAETGVPALKRALAKHGMELLEPIDFATSEELRRTYTGFQLPMGGLAKATIDIAQWIQRSPTVSSAAAGYNGIHAHLWTDATILAALEELRQQMGVDAVAVLANLSTTDKKAVSLWQVTFNMYGPNPVPKPDNRLAAKFWAPGTTYVASYFGKGFKGAVIADMKKNQVEAEHYAGYDTIVETLADTALATFDEDYAD